MGFWGLYRLRNEQQYHRTRFLETLNSHSLLRSWIQLFQFHPFSSLSSDMYRTGGVSTAWSIRCTPLPSLCIMHKPAAVDIYALLDVLMITEYSAFSTYSPSDSGPTSGYRLSCNQIMYDAESEFSVTRPLSPYFYFILFPWPSSFIGWGLYGSLAGGDSVNSPCR